MTMHLCGPALTTTGKKKGKVKFRNAEEARKARELDASWKDLQKKWGVDAVEKKRKRALAAETYKTPTETHRSTSQFKSLDTGWVACTKAPDKVYTGTKILGIGTMHKSNAVPVFSDDEAKAISSMRR